MKMGECELRKWAVVLLLVCALLAGCSKSGGSDEITNENNPVNPTGTIQYTPVSVPGTLVLPPGATYTPDSLLVRTARGTSPVQANGSFEALGLQEGPVLIVAETSLGTPLLFGWTGGDLSARTTAEVLVYYASGLFSLFPDTLNTIRQALKEAPEIDALADVIAAEIKENPEAFSDMNEAIAKALKDLLAAVAAAKTSSYSAGTGNEQSGLTINMLSQAMPGSLPASMGGFLPGDLMNAVLINPSNEQSGLATKIAAGKNMFEFTNRFIRPAYGYLEQTGYQRESDHLEIEEQKDIREIDIKSVKGFSGIFGTPWDLISGQQQAFEEITTGPFDLPMAPGAEKTHYRLTVIGVGINDGSEMTEAQRNKYTTMALQYLICQQIAPLLAQVVGPYSSLSKKSLTILLTSDNAVKDFTKAITNTAPQVIDAIRNNDLNAAMRAVMSLLATSSSLREALIKVVQESLSEEQFWSVTYMVDHVCKLLKLAEATGTVVSQLIQINHIDRSNKCDVWTLDATVPKLKLLPLEQDVATDDYCWFEAGVPDLSGNLPEGTVMHYIWTTSGNYGKLVNPDGEGQSTSFETTYNKVSYLANKQEGTDTITVEAILVQGTARESIDTATASVHVVAMRKCENRPYTFIYENNGRYGYVFTVLFIWHHRQGEYSYNLLTSDGGFMMTQNYDTAVSNHNVNMPTLHGAPIFYYDLADDELAIIGNTVSGERDTPEWRDAAYEEYSAYGAAQIAEAMAQVYWVTP